MNFNEQQILIIGASGLVGTELISILLERGFQASNILTTASEQSSGKAIEVEGNAFVLQAIDVKLFTTSPLVFQCASNEAAREWVPIALEAGCRVIDCSSMYRQDDGVPLVIPNVNGCFLQPNSQLIASPNCTTIVLLTAIQGLREILNIVSITVATYQSLSGAGRDGLQALEEETSGTPRKPNGVFPEPCAFNVFCHESTVNTETGFNGEEEKVIAEVHKIWNETELQVIPTCIRVPVVRVHTESITLTVNGVVSESVVLEAINNSKDVVLLNDEGHFPTALKASSSDVVLVGHVRVIPQNEHTIISLVACGDQIRTGAALNAVRIAEELSKISTHS